MRYNIYFDICAIVIFAVLIYLFYVRKTMNLLQNKVFLIMTYTALITAVADIASVVFELIPQTRNISCLVTASFIYYIGINSIPFLYGLYVVLITDSHKSFERKSKLLKDLPPATVLLLGIPQIINLVIIVGNLFTGWLFKYTITQSGLEYTRGFVLNLLYATTLYFIGFAVIYTARNKDIISKIQRIAIYSFVPISFIPVAIQAFMPQHLLGLFGIAMCLFMIFVTLQNQEDLIDPMTGLLNKNAFFSFVPVLYKNKRPFFVISGVLTNFRFLSKTFGLMNLSHVISKAADELNNLQTRGKTVYALGEANFAVVIPIEYANSDMVKKIQELFAKSWSVDNITMKLSVRLCIFNCPIDAENVDLLYDYIEIEKGRKGAVETITYARDIARTTEKRVSDIEQAIRRGLAEGNFEVHYQGIYSPSNGKFNSAEALLRLNDSVLGNVPPSEFIPIAERDGTIIEIGAFVFAEVCRFISNMNIEAFGLEYIEINLSVAQCMQETLANELLETIKKYNLSTTCINLEITETVASYSFELLEGNMQKLASSGIKFSLDDYGTGYSSMMSMVELPFHFVKIDRGIISAAENEKARIALGGTIAMLKEMKLAVVAEGVETEAQAKILIDMGCDYLQGFYYARPVPEKQFLSMLGEKNLNS